MKAWWQHYRSNLTPDECAAVVDYAQAFPEKQGAIGHGGTQTEHPMRCRTVRWLPRHDLHLRWLFDRIILNALEVNQHTFGLELSDAPRLRFQHAQFTTYDAGDSGHYDWHEDNCWLSDMSHDRKLTCCIQLTDPAAYDGGRLELERDNPPPHLFAQPGDMIFFPSHLRHRVTDVTRGTRHSLVLWFEGPRLR